MFLEWLTDAKLQSHVLCSNLKQGKSFMEPDTFKVLPKLREENILIRMRTYIQKYDFPFSGGSMIFIWLTAKSDCFNKQQQ